MKNKLFYIGTATVICLSVGLTLALGFSERAKVPQQPSGFSELCREASGEDPYRVSYLLTDGGLFPDTDEYLQLYEKAPLIVRAKASGKVEQLYKSTVQEAAVQEVYKGDGSLKGKTIDIYTPICFDAEYRLVTGAFANFMRGGEEYLIFLYPHGYTFAHPEGIPRENVYTTDMMLVPYFCLSELESRVAKADADGFAPYSELINSEFFAGDGKSLKRISAFKREMIKRYAKA